MLLSHWFLFTQVPKWWNKMMFSPSIRMPFRKLELAGCSERGLFFSGMTPSVVLMVQNRKGNFQCFLYAFCSWQHPKHEKANSPPLFSTPPSKVSLSCWLFFAASHSLTCQKWKQSKHIRNFHLKFALKIGREIPAFLTVFCFCRTSHTKRQIHPP